MEEEEFETVLRSIFKEEEWILVALGGVLGTAIGTLQAGLVLATGGGGRGPDPFPQRLRSTVTGPSWPDQAQDGALSRDCRRLGAPER